MGARRRRTVQQKKTAAAIKRIEHARCRTHAECAIGSNRRRTAEPMFSHLIYETVLHV